MKRMLATLVLCLSATILVASAQSPDTLRLAKLSVAARSTGNLLLEQILLRRLTIQSSGDLADGARHRLAENALETGAYAEAIRLLTSGDTASNDTPPLVRRDRASLGEAYRLAGDETRARQVLQAVLDQTPNVAQPDDAALAAVKSLDRIAGDVAETEHFRRGGVYQFNRYWEEARRHFEFVKTTPDAVEAAFQIGRGYSQSGQFAEAIPYYQRVIDQFPDSTQARDALLQSAAAYSRIGKTDEALARYQTFIDKYPTDDKIERAYMNPVDIYRDLGDDTKAVEWSRRAENAFRGKRGEALGIFAGAKIYAAKDDRSNEIAALDRLSQMRDLGGASVPGGTTVEEVASMRAYAARPKQLGAPVAKALSPTGARRAEYPVPHADILVRRAAAKSLDPRLLLAIMRQESRFDPNARSNAAARGLMQFTHPSAQKLATELGWTSYDDEELYSPENSIALACQYLADLFAMFPNQPEAVVASYNGGEDNVKRWISRAKSNDPERYVPEFVFGQTKDYVQRVMANYRVYQQLYDEQLRPR